MVRQSDSLITGGYDGQLCWWSISEKKLIRKIAAHERWAGQSRVRQMQQNAHDADDMLCKVWDAASGELLERCRSMQHKLRIIFLNVVRGHNPSTAVAGDGTHVHTAVWNTQTLIAEIETPVMYNGIRERDGTASAASVPGVLSDGNELAIGGIGKIGNIDHLGGPARLEVFDWQKGERRLEIEDNKKKGLIEQIIWSPNKEWILTAGGDHNGFLTYDVETGDLVIRMTPGH